MEPVSGQVSALAVSRRPRLGGVPPCSVTNRAWPWAIAPGMRRSPRRAPGLGSGVLPAAGSFPVWLEKGRAAPQPAPPAASPPWAGARGPQEPRPSPAPVRQSRRRSPHGSTGGTKVPAEHPRGDTAPCGARGRVVPAGSSAHPAGAPGPGLGSGVASEGSPRPDFVVVLWLSFSCRVTLWLHVVSGAVVGDSRGQQMLWQRSSRQS